MNSKIDELKSIETVEPSTTAVSNPPTNRWLQAGLTLLVLAAAIGLAQYLLASKPHAERRAPTGERHARLVETVTVQPSAQQLKITAWGNVKPSRALSLQAQVGGRIEQVAAGLAPGAIINAGTALVALEAAEYQTALKRAQSGLTEARASLALEQGQQEVARQEFELVGQPLTEAERALILRTPQLQSAQAQIAAAEAAVSEAELALARTRLTVPFDSLVLDESVTLGALVTPSAQLATLVGVEAWWVEVLLPVAQLQWVTPGDTVRLFMDRAWEIDQFREGRVVQVLGSLEEGGRLARILVEVTDPLARRQPELPKLLLGAFVRAEVTGAELNNAVALEPDWLREDDTVWLMTADNTLAVQAVQVAYRDAERVVVRAGLKAGDRVITSDIETMAEGMPLRTLQTTPAPTSETKPESAHE